MNILNQNKYKFSQIINIACRNIWCDRVRSRSSKGVIMTAHRAVNICQCIRWNPAGFSFLHGVAIYHGFREENYNKNNRYLKWKTYIVKKKYLQVLKNVTSQFNSMTEIQSFLLDYLSCNLKFMIKRRRTTRVVFL